MASQPTRFAAIPVFLATIKVVGVVSPEAQKEAIPALIEVVRDFHDASTRIWAIHLLASMGTDAKPAIPTLKDLLENLKTKPATSGRRYPAPDAGLEKAINAALPQIEPDPTRR